MTKMKKKDEEIESNDFIEIKEVKNISKEKIEMIISEWSDLPVLTQRIYDKYSAKIVSQDDTCVTFTGTYYDVVLKKI